MKPLLAMVHRDLVADLMNYRMTVSRLFLQPLVYIIVFGYIVGGLFPVPGGDYSEIVAPGVTAIAVMNSSFSSVGGAIVTGYYFRSMEGWLLTPVGLRTLMMGRVLSGLIYGTASGCIVTVFIWAILGIYPKAFLWHILLIVSGALFFSLLTIAVFLIPERPDKGQEVFSFFLMPMTFFGCTFYTYSMLKPPFSYIALLMPTTYLSEGLRASYNPGMSHMDTGIVLAGLISGLAALFYISDRLFQRKFKDFLW